jgi:hypothetical protein
MSNATPSLPELYWNLEQIDSAIVALEQIQQARERRRSRLIYFHRPSKNPECATALPSIPMSA